MSTVIVVALIGVILVGIIIIVQFNDWIPVWHTVGKPYGELTWEENKSYFIIYYSPKRSRYKLKIGGFKPKCQPEYKTVIDKLNNLNGTPCRR
jgi:hypothetical protein